MRINLLLISLLLLTVSCAKQKEKTKIPEDIITPEKMEQIMTDAHLVEGALIYIRSQKGDSEELKDYYYAFVFNKHGVTKEEYEKSLEFYKEHIGLLQDIFQDVFNNLDAKRDGPAY